MSQQSGGVLQGALTAATVTTAGAVLSLENDSGVDRFVELLVLDVTTEATGAATVDAGIDSDGTTSDDTLIDGLDVGAAAILGSNRDTPGTNGLGLVKWPAGEFLVVTASATLAGLVGRYHVRFFYDVT